MARPVMGNMYGHLVLDNGVSRNEICSMCKSQKKKKLKQVNEKLHWVAAIEHLCLSTDF